MQLLIVSGSHRAGSQSSKIGRYMAARATDLGVFTSAEHLDLSESEMPFWSEEAFDAKNEKWQAHLSALNGQLSAAQAYVIISPEWHGMVPSKLKNLLLFANIQTVGHKPALITAVSASRGGAYPIVELRSSGYKNSRLCFVPEHLIVRNANEVLNDGEASGTEDEFIRGRVDFALRGLGEYARVMAQMDRSVLIDDAYKNGM
ncbi:MAG: NAD(P)H-dependent oxidoreductase [Pseudomonadota bacterium]